MESISPNIDISKLTEADRKDLSRTLANESQKMNMQQSTIQKSASHIQTSC